jgi:hypothetical protein
MARPVNLAAPFRARGALARRVALVDDGFVEDVAAEGHTEVRVWVGLEVEGFEGGKGVDGCEEVLGGEDVRGDLVGDDEAILYPCGGRRRRRRRIRKRG